MRVIGVVEPGGPDALAVHDIAEPHAEAGQVRIAVRAAAVNPTDISVREGRRGMGHGPPPYVPGMDAAGVLDEVGPPTAALDTAGWQEGDNVMAIALPLQGHGGAYAEFLVADADSLARMPSGRSFAEAATLPMNGLTALQALDAVAVPPAGTLAVIGAAGTLGGYLIQLAKPRGLTVIADAAYADRDRVVDLGADHVVQRGDEVATRIREVVPEGVDGLVDAAILNELALPAVRPGGHLASLRRWPGVQGSGVTVHQIWVFDDYHRGDRLELLRRAVEDGTLTLHVADTLPPERAAEAHRRLAAGGLRGRLVFVF